MATAYPGNKPYIFLSYAHADKELAHQVVDYLEGYNFNVWFDDGITSGSPWEKVIADKIKNPNCWIMVFLATKNSLASEWCANELRFAKRKGKKFINVVIGNPTFPDEFELSYDGYQFLYEEKFPNRKAMLDKLVEDLLHHAMNPDKPKDTPKDTTKDTPKETSAAKPLPMAKASEVEEDPKVSTPIPEGSKRSVAPKETPAPSSTEGFEFTIIRGAAQVSGYTGTDTRVIIPSTITRKRKTYKVTSIGKEAFQDCTSLTSITIPNSITSIGEHAFYGCDNLTIYCETNSEPKGWDADWNPSKRPVIWFCRSLKGYDFLKILPPSPTKGLRYIIDGRTAQVSGYKGTETNIIIPVRLTKKRQTYKVTSIGEGVFRGRKKLTSITIPDSVTSIGDWAFHGCTNLTSITIPKGVTSIGKGAFYDCKSLTSIIIPSSVTSIGEYAFSSCNELKFYSEAKSRSYYWKDSFQTSAWNVQFVLEQDGITYAVTKDNFAIVVRCAHSATEVTIPKAITIDNTTYNVTSIGWSAFFWCKNLTSITIPDSVTSIGDWAFSHCSALTTITIPDRVTSIGRDAFYECSSLTTVFIPNSVTSIGERAFADCKNLTIYCEAKSKPEGWHAKWNPRNRPVTWGPLELNTAEGLKFSIVAGTAKVTNYKGTDAKVIIPTKITYDGNSFKVTEIGIWAFSNCKNLTSITIPDHVTSIGYCAFLDCKNLTSITIPDSVTSIGDGAFGECDSLTSIVVDENNQNYKSIDGNLYSKDGSTLIQYAFGKTDTTFTIPEGVTSIGDRAFAGCENLTSITIPDHVTSIGVWAFAACTSLTSITIPNSVTAIEACTFANCANLTSITIPDSVTSIWGSAFQNCGSLTSITIPDSVTSIRAEAFKDCRNLTSITIPDSVTSIGRLAFCNCDSLTSIDVDKNNTHYKSIDGNLYSKDGSTLIQYAFGKTDSTFSIPDSVTSIGDEAFYECRKLISITIPNGVTSIEEGAFYGCSSLTSITIPDSVTSIGDKAFEECRNLTSVTIPNSVTTIGKSAFYKCKNLTSINIPESVTSIGEWAFSSCDSLTSITIPDSVTSIGDFAFYKCKNLTSINIPNSVTTIRKHAFASCTSLTSVTIPDSVTSIREAAFASCSSLTSITIPDSVTSIEVWAFQDCTNLTSITIPDSVNSIGHNAFYNCSRLTICCEAASKPEGWDTGWNRYNCPVVWNVQSVFAQDGITYAITKANFATVGKCIGTATEVTIPSTVTIDGTTYTVTTIGDWAFAYCTSLTSVTIPDSVTSIGERAFYECRNLTSITIPDSVTSIGRDAFWYCNKLTIYCKTKSKPKGWNDYWNTSNRPIVWGCGSSSPKEDEVCGSSKPSTDSTTTSKPSPTEGLKFTIVDGTATVSDYTGTDTEVIIPATIIRDGKTYKVTAIGESAFYVCNSLTSITIPNSVTSIGKRAFYRCKNLTIYCEAKSKPEGWHTNWNPDYHPVVWGHGSSEQPTAPKGLFEFITDEGLKFTVTDGTATVIGYKGTNTMVIIPAKITYDGNSYMVTTIGEWAFSRCENLTSITIPNSVTTIGEWAFYNCDSLTTVTIPESVTSIGKSAFLECTSLASITIPNSVTSIGDGAFLWCYSLTSISIPKGVKSIGESAFLGCKKLTSIDVDKNNTNYKSIDGNLYSRDGSTLIQYAIGKTDTTFTIPDSVTSIGRDAFYECKNLTSITIPDAVTSIGYCAFYECKNLTSITIPDSVTFIGDGAFDGCENITSITIPNSVTTIGDGAFYNCTILTSITIPNSITSIGKQAFFGCENLTSITIPDSVTSIGEWAFWYCKNLTIYCETKSKPSNWHAKWNPHNRPVVWGYKGE